MLAFTVTMYIEECYQIQRNRRPAEACEVPMGPGPLSAPVLRERDVEQAGESHTDSVNVLTCGSNLGKCSFLFSHFVICTFLQKIQFFICIFLIQS